MNERAKTKSAKKSIIIRRYEQLVSYDCESTGDQAATRFLLIFRTPKVLRPCVFLYTTRSLVDLVFFRRKCSFFATLTKLTLFFSKEQQVHSHIRINIALPTNFLLFRRRLSPPDSFRRVISLCTRVETDAYDMYKMYNLQCTL